MKNDVDPLKIKDIREASMRHHSHCTKIIFLPLILGALFMLAIHTGCSSSDESLLADVGEACAQPDECKEGLICSRDGTCQEEGSPGTAVQNQACKSQDDCMIGLVCARTGTCQPNGIKGVTDSEGTACVTTMTCAPDLVCSHANQCAKPGTPGTKGKGEKCAKHEECQAYMICGYDGTCQDIPHYQGLECEDPTLDPGPLRVFFEINSKKDFYRLPFPNDIRMVSGHMKISDHPNPGTIIPGDPISQYYKLMESDLDGFGTNQRVFFRFSNRVDYDTLSFGNSLGDGKSLYLLDINPASPGYGTTVSSRFLASTERTNYICQNWLAVGPSSGSPLRSSNTYAAIITDTLKGKDGKALKQDKHFAAMVASSAPSSASLQAAYDAYKPLRDFLADKGFSASKVLGAAVFTTQTVEKPMSRFREAVRSINPPPSLDGFMLCGSGGTSPCDDGLSGTAHERGCFTTDPAFDELQATISLPVFQKGTPPYKTWADGGEIAYDASGLPEIQRFENVNLAVTVPKGMSMPENGWPVVLYAHGTGGTYRSHVSEGIATALSSVGGTGFAVIGIDQVLHGPRRGASTEGPDTLVYNFMNPKAARDNFLQGAADYFSLARLAESLQVTAAESPTGQAIRFDPSNIYFMGHSQGSTSGVLFVVFEPLIKAVVLSGAGGDLIESLLHKTNPVDISAAIKIVLADADVSANHPLLNLFQMLMERSDPVNFGRAIHSEPLTVGGETLLSRSVLQIYGTGDTYSPPETMKALAHTIWLEIADPALDPIDPLKVVPTPISGNFSASAGGSKITAAMIQYAPEGYDGHFVTMENPDAISQWTRFLSSAVIDGVPTVYAP